MLTSIWLGKNFATKPIIVKSDFGTLIGSTSNTAWTNKVVYQFIDVRYGEMPTGERRRFKVYTI